MKMNKIKGLIIVLLLSALSVQAQEVDDEWDQFDEWAQSEELAEEDAVEPIETEQVVPAEKVESVSSQTTTD